MDSDMAPDKVAAIRADTASPPLKKHHSPLTQTLGVLAKPSDALKAQGMTLGDAVMMRVYLVGDPDLGGKMDFAGMMAAYTTLFGAADQPNRPARVTMQVATGRPPAAASGPDR